MRTSLLRLRTAWALTAAPLALLLAPAASTGASAARRCRSGELPVRLAAKSGARAPIVCRNVAPGGAASPAALRRRAAATLPTARELRAALPARYRSRVPLTTLSRLERAIERSPARRSAVVARTAHAAAGGAGACSAAPTFSVDPVRSAKDGVTAVTTGGGWAAGSGSTKGQLVQVDASVGRGGTATQTTKDCVSWDPCPTPEGIVRGGYEYLLRQVYRAEADGGIVTWQVTLRVTARLTARVGDDGRVRDFEWVADGVSEAGGDVRVGGRLLRHVPIRIVRLHITVAGVDPHAGSGAKLRPAGSVYGNRGALAADQVDVAQALYGLATEVIHHDAGRALLEAEHGWQHGRCLTVVLTPQDPEVGPGERVEVRVTVQRTDGGETQVPFTAHPVDGAIGPPSGTTPATVTWTAPQQLDDGRFETFYVEVSSKQGTAEGAHYAHARRDAPWYRMTFSGEGDYARHEMGSGNPQVDARHAFAWRSTTATRFPFFDELPAGVPTVVNTDATELTGRLYGWRTDGAGRHDCPAVAPDASLVVGTVRQTRTADGGFDMTVTPFQGLFPPGGIQPPCDTGAWLFWTKGAGATMTISFHLSPQDLTRDVIALPMTPQNALDPDCRGGEANGDWACAQSVTWTGTLRLERIDPVPGWTP